MTQQIKNTYAWVAIFAAATAFGSGCIARDGGEGVAASESDEPAFRLGDPIATPGIEPPAGRTRGDGEQVVVDDGGTVCMYPDELPSTLEEFYGPQLFEQGDRVAVRVQLPECLSSSCDVDRQASCEVIHDGDTLYVESAFSYTSLESSACTLDCGKLTATCFSGQLKAGEYTIVHGGVQSTLTIGGSNDACPQFNECQVDGD